MSCGMCYVEGPQKRFRLWCYQIAGIAHQRLADFHFDGSTTAGLVLAMGEELQSLWIWQETDNVYGKTSDWDIKNQHKWKFYWNEEPVLRPTQHYIPTHLFSGDPPTQHYIPTHLFSGEPPTQHYTSPHTHIHLSSDYPWTQYYIPTLVLRLSTDTVLYPNTCPLIIHWQSIIPQHMCSDYPLTQYYTQHVCSDYPLTQYYIPTCVYWLPNDTVLYPNISAQIAHWHSIILNMCALIIHWHSIIPNMCALIIHWHSIIPNICAQITHWHSIIPNMCVLITQWHSIIPQHKCSDYPLAQYYTPTCVLWLPTDTVLYPNKCAKITH